MEFLLNTIRKVDNDQTKEIGLSNTEKLDEKLAIIFLNPEDLEKYNLKKSSNVRVASEFGDVIVKVETDEGMPYGVVAMPVSLWSNQITGNRDNNLLFKNIKVSLEPTTKAILTFSEIINKIRGT